MNDTALLADEAAERAVLGSILIDATDRCREKALAVARARLRPDDFSLIVHRETFRAMLGLDDAGEKVDAVTLGPALLAAGIFPEAQEPMDFLARLGDPEVTPSAANVAAYVAQVAAAARRRGVVRACAEGQARARDLTLDVGEVVNETVARLTDAEAAHADPARQDLAAAVERAISTVSGEGEAGRHWSTGVPALDDLTGGLGAGQVWDLCGRSQMCKTGLALGLAQAVLDAGGSALMARYEEGVEAMLFRLASLMTGIPYSDALAREVSQPDADRFADALRAIERDYEGRLHFLVGAKVPKVEQVIADVQPSIVVYDTLQAMAQQVGRVDERRHDLNVANLCSNVARLALKHQHTAVVLSQVRKGVMGIPNMSDLRESGAIEESCDVALLLWWPVVERGSQVWDQGYIIRAGKNRIRGRRTTVVLRIDPGTQKLGDALSPEDAQGFLRTVGL